MNSNYPTPAQLPGLRRLWKTVFGDSDAFLDAFFATGFSPRRCRCIAQNGQIASAVYWFDCTWQEQKVAYLYALATAEEFRGQGLATGLLREVHSLLAAQNYAGAVLVPESASLFPFYEQMGYLPLNCAETVSVSAASPIPLRKIDTAEYAKIRRHFLSEKDAILGIETTRFLSKICTLYAGNRWVLAGFDTGTAFFGMELLGDPAAAPGILGALGKETGEFRIPGSAPFALYLPLCIPQIPRYFGLPLD